MGFDVMKHRGKGIFLAVLVLLFVGLFVDGYEQKHGYSIGNGYRLLDHGQDARSIKKGNNIIIGPTLVDWTEVLDFVVGLRMPTKILTCRPGNKMIKVINKRLYFILHLKTGIVSEFETEQAFKNDLSALNISGEVELDFSSFDRLWDRHANTYKDIEKWCGG